MNNLTFLIDSALSRELHALIYTLGYRAEKEFFEVYAVGGFVRDLLLGKENRDLDLVVEGSAVDFAQSLARIMPGKLRCYERFGTATLALPKGIVFDMVTARKEFYAAPGALPSVEESTLKSDLYRRDFTINTMACALNPKKFGRLYDYFGGRDDLERGIIRVLYKLSFVDDPLRIIRAIRFEQRFGFSIEKESLALLHKAIKSRVLGKVSKERLYNEVRLIFREPFPEKILNRLQELGLLKEIFPRLIFSADIKKRLERLGEILRDLASKKPKMDFNHFIIYLSALFWGLSEHDWNYLFHLMRLKRKERYTVSAILKNTHTVIKKINSPTLKPSELYFLLKDLPDEGLVLMMTLQEDPIIHERIYYYWDNLIQQEPSVTGKDLLNNGLQPGPVFNFILKRLHEAVLDGKIEGREEELRFVTFLMENNTLMEETGKGEN